MLLFIDFQRRRLQARVSGRAVKPDEALGLGIFLPTAELLISIFQTAFPVSGLSSKH